MVAPTTTDDPQTLWIPSPHHRERTVPVDTFVLHAMGEWVIDGEGVYRHCTDLLRELGLSVHAFCLPDGRIVESVAVDRVARHARSYNDRSIGLEFIVPGPHDEASLLKAMANAKEPPYTSRQLQQAARWFRQHADRLGLDERCFRSHAELDPERKQDPGVAFDMAGFLAYFRT